jgi:hypothetical protein
VSEQRPKRVVTVRAVRGKDLGESAEFLVVGAHALAAHGPIRATKDKNATGRLDLAFLTKA